MRSNYKKIGKFVRQVGTKNTDLTVTDLKGISINKEFMPSVANVNGTDLSKYRVVEKEQFAFNPMHVGRDEILPISMLETDEKVIVSPAYVVFKVIDKSELDPEYLMMWCRRPEFDRNAWFTTDSSVRGGFNWNDFCEMELPVPPIEKQREIVKEYNTIVNRIKLNEQLNQKLEETAQAIYKQWFVDFEFPMSEEYAISLGKPELTGKPYKSYGGEMVYNEELQKELPANWTVESFTKVVSIKGGGTPSTDIEEYWNGNIPFFTPKDVSNSIYAFITEKNITEMGLSKCSSKLYPLNTTFVTARGTVGEVAMAGVPMAMNQSCYAIVCKYPYYAYQLTTDVLNKLKNEAIGAVFAALVTKDFDSALVCKPAFRLLYEFERMMFQIYNSLGFKQRENILLLDFVNLLLSRMVSKPSEAVCV